MKSTNFKICEVIIDITAYEKKHFWLFLLNPRNFQMLVNLRRIFVTCFELNYKEETSSWLFYHFNKLTISWDLLIFSSWYLLYLVGWFHPFKIVKNQKNDHPWLLRNCFSSWQIEKSLELGPSPINHSKYFAKILSITISTSWPSFMT